MDADLEVRPPKQRRSREAWDRVLDAGVAVLEDGGYDAFTIAAVCERAQVAPTAIYARTTSKDALFLAVYEHGIARLRAEQDVFADAARWAGLAPAQLVRAAVAEMVGISLRHAAVPARRRPGLRGAPRGPAARFALQPGAGGGVRARRAPRRGTAIRHADPEAAVRVVLRHASSRPRSSGSPTAPASPRRPPVDDDAFVADLGEMAVRYLLGAPRRRPCGRSA